MSIRRVGVVSLCIGLLASLIVGVGVSAPTHATASKQLKFAFLVPELADAYWVAGEKGAKAEAAKDNISLQITGTNTFSASGYNNALQSVISSGVNGILIAPGDPVASNGLIKQARSKGIAVATVVVDAPKSARQFFIGPNATLFGQQQGQRITAYLHAKHVTGPVEMAVLSCSPTAISQVQEHEAVVKAVTTGNPYKSEFQVKPDLWLNSTADPTTNLAAYQSLASGHPNVKVVMGECGLDPVSAGLVNQRQHTGWVIAGDSTLPQAIKLLKQGYISWLANEAPYETLQWAMSHMAAALRGQAKMPSGVFPTAMPVIVTNPAYMKSIHFPPGGGMWTIARALKSPDATG